VMNGRGYNDDNNQHQHLVNNDNQAVEIHRWDNRDKEGDNTDDQDGNNTDGADDADGESWVTGRKPLSFIVIFISSMKKYI
jgi:hypothetical protein